MRERGRGRGEGKGGQVDGLMKMRWWGGRRRCERKGKPKVWSKSCNLKIALLWF